MLSFTAARTGQTLAAAAVVLLHFLRNVSRQRCFRVLRILTLVLFGDVISQVFFGLLIFPPAVIDLIGLQVVRDLGIQLVILITFDVRRHKPELIAFLLGKFPAHLLRVVVAIDMNVLAFLAAMLADLFIAPFKIRSAAERAPPGIADVSAIKRVNDEGAVALTSVYATAAGVRLAAKINNVNKGVALRPDIAGLVHP